MSLKTDLQDALNRFPRVPMTHAPTPLEPMPNLGRDLGLSLLVKRDDCTGIGFGGNKVRQLEYYLGAAQAENADTILITGAIQSNFVRTAAAMAGRLGMACHIQLEERVAGVSDVYRESGNVLLDHLLGARLHAFPEGENEAGADAALQALAGRLRDEGARPYVIPLGAGHPPLGSLGYVDAAIEIAAQLDATEPIDEIIIASGSANTHAGLLFGLRALGRSIPVRGICVRREAGLQTGRVAQRVADIGALLDLPVSFSDIFCKWLIRLFHHAGVWASLFSSVFKTEPILYFPKAIFILLVSNVTDFLLVDTSGPFIKIPSVICVI